MTSQLSKVRSYVRVPQRKHLLLGGAIVLVLVIAVFALIQVQKIGFSDAKKCGPKNYLNDITPDELSTNPNKFKGKCVQVIGRVFTDEKVEGKTAWQVFTKPESSEGNVIVGYEGQSTVSKDEYLRAFGVVKGEYSGKNAFGATLKLPVVLANTVEKADRAAAISPARKTAQVNQAQEKGGFTVTLGKVEFGDNETRAFLKVKNSSGSKVSFYSFNSKLVQGGSQINQKQIYEQNKENEIPSDIVSNTEESGIVYFEKADPAQASNLNFEAFTEAGYQTLQYSFSVSP